MCNQHGMTDTAGRTRIQVSLKRQLHAVRLTGVWDGKASPQISQGGAGAQPRLSGQSVAVMILPLSTHGAHRLQAEDLSVT